MVLKETTTSLVMDIPEGSLRLGDQEGAPGMNPGDLLAILSLPIGVTRALMILGMAEISGLIMEDQILEDLLEIGLMGPRVS